MFSAFSYSPSNMTKRPAHKNGCHRLYVIINEGLLLANQFSTTEELPSGENDQIHEPGTSAKQ